MHEASASIVCDLSSSMPPRQRPEQTGRPGTESGNSVHGEIRLEWVVAHDATTSWNLCPIHVLRHGQRPDRELAVS